MGPAKNASMGARATSTTHHARCPTMCLTCASLFSGGRGVAALAAWAAWVVLWLCLAVVGRDWLRRRVLAMGMGILIFHGTHCIVAYIFDIGFGKSSLEPFTAPSPRGSLGHGQTEPGGWFAPGGVHARIGTLPSACVLPCMRV